MKLDGNEKQWMTIDKGKAPGKVRKSLVFCQTGGEGGSSRVVKTKLLFLWSKRVKNGITSGGSEGLRGGLVKDQTFRGFFGGALRLIC